MKKKISLFLVAVMLLSLLPMSLTTVSAATAKVAAPELCEGFEKWEGGNLVAGYVGNGISVSSSALPEFDIAPRKNETYTISAMVKATATPLEDTVSFAFTMDATPTSTSSLYTYDKTVTETLTLLSAGLKQNEWVKVTTQFTYDGTTNGKRYGKLSGSSSNQEYNTTPIGSMKIVVGGGVNYQIDNVIVMPEKDSAYWVQNFDDGIILDSGAGVGYTTAITDGVGGSKHAMGISVTTDYKSPYFDVTLRKGYSYDISMWVRADEEILAAHKNTVSVIFCQKAADTSITSTPWKQVYLTLDESLTRGEWVYASTTITDYDGKSDSNNKCDVTTVGYMLVRIGTGCPSSVTGSGTINFSIDDLTVMPRGIYKDQTPNEICEGMELYTFEGRPAISTSSRNEDGWKGLYSTTEVVSTSGQNITIPGVEDPLKGYIKITSTAAWTNISKDTIDIRNGVSYNICFWAKAENDAAVGQRPSVFITKGNTTDTENVGSGHPYYFASIASVTDLNGNTSQKSADFGLTTAWRRYVMTYRSDTVTYNTATPTSITFRVSNKEDLSKHSWSMGNFEIYQDISEEEDTKNVLNVAVKHKAYKTSDTTYHYTFSTGVQAGGVTNTITRIMYPYKNREVIRHLYTNWKNEDDMMLNAEDISKVKMVVNAKDKDDYFSEETVVYVKTLEEPATKAVAEFDQTIWEKNTPNLTAIVDYNCSASGKTMLALCAMYDENNKMIKHDIQEFALVNGEGSQNLTMTTDAKATTAKVFLWEKDSLAPVTDDVAAIEKTTDAHIIYVDEEKGVDTNSGVLTKPLKTINKALSMHKQLMGMTGSTNIYKTYIVLMPGYHTQSKGISIDRTYTNEDYELVVTSYNKNDKAVISGGQKITGFTPWQNGIYKAEVEKGLPARQLYVNGVKATRARSEGILEGVTNTNVYKYDSTQKGYVLEKLGPLHSTDTSLLSYSKIDDLEFVFYSYWTMRRCQVASVTSGTDEEGKTIAVLTMDEPGWTDINNKIHVSTRRPHYMENAIELLDQEGEWYMDTDDGVIYYKPRVSIGEDITKAEVILPRIDNYTIDNENLNDYTSPLLNIKGLYNNSVENVTFDNVEFAHTTWSRPNTDKAHGDQQNNNVYSGSANPEGAIELTYTTNINFTNCVFSKLGINGIKLIKGVKNTDIIGNEFYDISASSVVLGPTGVTGESGGSLRNPAEYNKIDTINFSNNYVHHVSSEYQSAAAVTVGYPSNALISHNEICFIPYSGLHVGWGWDSRYNNPNTGMTETTTNLTIDILDNYFHDLFQGNIFDGGAIYTLGLSGGTAEDRNQIKGNFTENIGSGGPSYYNDQGSTYYEVSYNVTDQTNSFSAYDIVFEKWKGPSGSYNVNLTASSRSHGLYWHHNYATSPKMFVTETGKLDTSCTFDPLILAGQKGTWEPEVQAIIDNAGIEPKYRNNFRHGLQGIVVLGDVSLSVGETANNTPNYATRKNAEYKSNKLVCHVSSSNPAVATATEKTITAVGTGTATITYTVVENGRVLIAKTNVTVK